MIENYMKNIYEGHLTPGCSRPQSGPDVRRDGGKRSDADGEDETHGDRQDPDLQRHGNRLHITTATGYTSPRQQVTHHHGNRLHTTMTTGYTPPRQRVTHHHGNRLHTTTTTGYTPPRQRVTHHHGNRLHTTTATGYTPP